MKGLYLFFKLALFSVLLIYLSGCEFFPEKIIIDEGENIRFVFDEGLNDDPRFRLSKDENGCYFMELDREDQNIQKISVRLLDGDEAVETKGNGRKQKVGWKNNLYWWLLEGDTVANITRTYFNPFTGEIQYVNLPPLVNWRDVLVPTINSASYTNELTGRANTVIAPIGKMRGDTMRVYVRYYHQITKHTEGSYFYSTIGSKEIVDSVKIVLK